MSGLDWVVRLRAHDRSFLMRVFLAPSADLARKVLSEKEVLITVEAEYGAYVAEGRVYTAAHHQPPGTKYAGRHLVEDGRPSPCNDTAIPFVDDNVEDVGAVILVSHVDLDTFGGCLRTMFEFADLFPGPRPDAACSINTIISWGDKVAFWNLAEFVDVHGAHKIGEAGASERTIRKLYAFWAWLDMHKPKVPRDQVTALVLLAGVVLCHIFFDDAAVLAAGDAFRADERALNERTFSRSEGGVIIRVATRGPEFCNHLYVDPDGVPAKAVACFNTETGSVTISLADPVPGVSCRAIVQRLWGLEAGGHDGIAGSPRERRMNDEEFLTAVQTLMYALA